VQASTPKHLRRKKRTRDHSEDSDSLGSFDVAEVEGSLAPQPKARDGSEYLVLTIEKIGLKKSTKFLDSTVSVSVFSGAGSRIEDEQETPPSNDKDGNYVVFRDRVFLQTPIGNLPNDAAIFFEFKHLKAKKGKKSTRAWAFMEMDETTSGAKLLELWVSGVPLNVELYSLTPSVFVVLQVRKARRSDTEAHSPPLRQEIISPRFGQTEQGR
jgi:Axin interactor dorsalisation-associated protein, C-terminal